MTTIRLFTPASIPDAHLGLTAMVGYMNEKYAPSGLKVMLDMYDDASHDPSEYTRIPDSQTFFCAIRGIGATRPSLRNFVRRLDHALQRLLPQGQPDFSGIHAACCGAIAKVLSQFNRADESEPFLLRCIDLTQELYSRNPEAYAQTLAAACLDYARILNSQNRSTEAVICYQTALPALKVLVRKDPARHRLQYGTCCADVADALARTATAPEAEALYKEALDVFSQMAADGVDFTTAWIAGIYLSLGKLLAGFDRAEEAEFCLRHALNLYREPMGHPRSKAVQWVKLRATCLALADLLLSHGRHAEAALLLKEARDAAGK